MTMPQKRKNIITSKLQPKNVRMKIDFNTSTSYHEHEEVYYYSTSYCDAALKIKPQDVKQKMMIASNITVECKTLKANNVAGKTQCKLKPILSQLNQYTNLPMDELKPIYDSIITRNRSFTKALRDIRVIPEPTAGLLADDIRNTFVKYILELKQFPSKMDLLKDLKELLVSYSNESSSIPIQRLVRNKLIKYQHFPEFNRYILTEHPENVCQRTLYLSSVRAHRMQQKNFVYVEVRRIMPRGTASFVVGLAAIPSIDKIEKFFTKDSTDPIAKKWLQQRIVPLIPENSVVILAQPKIQNKLTVQGKRFDFIKWLDDNGISYGKNPHTAELYSLFTKYNKESLMGKGVYDHVFLNAGFSLIHFSPEWRKLNFFKTIWGDIHVMDAYHPGRSEGLKQKILNAAAMFSNTSKKEDDLIVEEFKTIKEDRVMEDIIENVYEMVKKGDIQMLDFPKECCGDKTDYFETHVCEIILDI